MPALEEVPIIDLRPFLNGTDEERRKVAELVDKTNREIGFLVVTGHGFDLDLLAKWFDVSRRFFEQPADTKAACMPAVSGDHQGYHQLAASGLAAKEGQEAPPDLREYFMIGRLDTDAPYFQDESAKRFYKPNRWPEQPIEFREIGERYYRAVDQLGRQLMSLFGVALGLGQGFFEPYINRQFSVVSSIYYPAQRVAPMPGQLRAGAHTDYGSLTILAPTDSPGGLQVRTLAGDWVDVPYVPGAFVINIGDMMQRWTNDRWLSNMHRVANPPAASAATPKPRQSIAFFLHPNYDAVIECLPTCTDAANPPKHAAILAGEYMREKEAAIAQAKPTKAA
ncbi:isopenicillin N synthase family dioxygenase [Lichenihabitans psoromatis]|uniref:isopenicillin N synthase family dioxygenase n=1 Tax=Lichenihabitans psoromatis TaxID=2528642 RepID=UPI00103629E1|nr:2-oxoglutarate and iron-dependent oxygenase domain-containing protein [Lichenihabitans psoromatis]